MSSGRDGLDSRPLATLAVGKGNDLRTLKLGLLIHSPWFDSYFYNRNQFSITSLQGWWKPMLGTVKWVKKVSYGGVFDLAVEQPQLFRKLHLN